MSAGKTPFIMLIVVLRGLAVVLASTVSVYFIFRGKVKITPHNY
ncbi:MAG: hypothetical protein WEC72_03555 [Chthoniobacterales bacterium]